MAMNAQLLDKKQSVVNSSVLQRKEKGDDNKIPVQLFNFIKNSPNQTDYRISNNLKQYQKQYPINTNYQGNMPIQRKFAADLDLNDFSGFTFGANLDDRAKQRAFYIWEERQRLSLPQIDSSSDYFQAEKKEKEEEIKNALASSDPNVHPETSTFIKKMTAAPFNMDNNNAIILWDKILHGKDEQKKLNNAARLEINTDQLAIMYGKQKGDFLYTNDNDEIRNNNQYYKDVAQTVKPYLKIGPSKKLALWSGGYDLSNYAAKRGCITLEESDFGKVIDNLYLSDVWNVIGPLWNIISKTFVQKYIEDKGNQFHVFIRAYDPSSVLIRQEVDQIYTMGMSKQNIFWHCMVELSGLYHEIKKYGDVDMAVDTDHSVNDENECLKRLLDFYELHQKDKEHQRAYAAMNKGFQGNLAISFDEAREHIAVSYFQSMAQREAYLFWEQNGKKEVQAKEDQERNLYEGIQRTIKILEKQKIEKMCYLIWKGKGAPEGQTEEQRKEDYTNAEAIFVNAVREREVKIDNERNATKEDRINAKAKKIWENKKLSNNQSKEEMDKDYYEGKAFVDNADNEYKKKINEYAKLEICLDIT